MENRRTKKVLKNWVKVALLISFWIVGTIVISKLVCASAVNFEDYANKCDKKKGSICSYYEVREHMFLYE